MAATLKIKNIFMNDKEQMMSLLSEIIAKQAIILGPDIAIMKARSVKGLSISDEGKVTAIDGDAQAIVSQLIDAYVSLSGQIVKSAIEPIFAKYPGFKS
jgi:hypothetical protein